MTFFEAEREIQFRQIRERLIELSQRILRDAVPIGGWLALQTGRGQGPQAIPPFPGRGKSAWKPFEIGPGAAWGREGFDITVWFRTSHKIPKSMRGKTVCARLHAGGESLVYVNKKPAQGLDENRDIVRLTDKARGGEKIDLLLESYNSAWKPSGYTPVCNFDRAELVVFDQAAHDLYWDLRVAFEVAEQLESDSQYRNKILNLLSETTLLADTNITDDEAFDESVKKASRYLRAGLKEFQGSQGWGKIVLTGHSHIDTAWLWPLRETQRKCARTFSTVLQYMEQYPEYLFSQSQPQLYEYVKEHYPELYARIKKQVKAGRWEICGAGWIEEDNNVPSGESLIRQFLYGNRFYEREFGVRSRVAWLPDSFGYTWSLPQILKKAGIDYFVTSKIGWCEYNKEFPYSYFWWQGVDGTKIFAYLPKLNYNGNLVPKDIREQWKGFKQKDLVDETAFSFGWGDGGGGPTIEMLETGKRLKDFVEIPKLEFGMTEPFLDRVNEKTPHEAMPVWNGELYLELHRGCQTTQARTKRYNRKCESALRAAEFASAWASLHRQPYPQKALYDAWKTVLLNQFHDILPGSSITEVYTDAEAMYAEALESAHRAQNDALKHLAQRIDTRGEGVPVVVTNSCSWARTDVVEIPLPKGVSASSVAVIDASGELIPCQVSGTGKDKKLVFLARQVPSMGYATYWIRKAGKGEEISNPISADNKTLENGYVRLRFNRKGQISSIYDKWHKREIVPKGQAANVLRMYHDRPSQWEAWDVDYNYKAKFDDLDGLESIEILESGPVRAVVHMVRKGENCTLTQDITIYRHTPRIDFKTHADWREKRRLLKAIFPVEVLSPKATYEIQFGAIERSTHENTMYDRAQFEVPAQRWADLGETGYGVSLLNDCKYGYAIKGNEMSISLLRGTILPDQQADEGEHDFVYSVFPHGGSWQESGVVRNAAELNTPLMAIEVEAQKGPLPPNASLVSVNRENVIIDTIKKSEDGKELMIRLYEAHGQRTETVLTFQTAPKTIAECNLMEEDQESVPVQNKRTKLSLRPFDLRTLKIQF